MDSYKLWLFIHVRVQVVFTMDNIWIGPWAIYPLYMDPTLLLRLYLQHSEHSFASLYNLTKSLQDPLGVSCLFLCF